MHDKDNFRAEVAAWLEANCPPSMRRPIVAEEMVWGGSRLQFQNEDQRLWFERCRDKGWFAPGWPSAYGGGGLTPKQARIVEEEMTRLGCRQPQYNLGVWMLGPVLLEVGTEEQKREHLIPMMRGEQRWCQGFSEPNAGSDLASLKTSAQRVSDAQGEAYIINGSKIWTSYGDQADWMYALVRTDASARKQQGISFVLIDMHAPGVSVKPIELISGKSSFCEVFFDNVRVPVRQCVGAEGEGWAVAKKLLQHERAAMSKFAEGGAPSHDALAVARPYLFDEAGQCNNPVARERLAMLPEDAFVINVGRGNSIDQAALVEALVTGGFQALNKAGGGMERGRGGLEKVDQALVQLFAHVLTPDSNGASLTYWPGKWRRTDGAAGHRH